MENKMPSGYRYGGLEFDDAVNGEGIGATLYLQFCPHHCKGCHNPETQSKKGGQPFTEEILEKIFLYFEEKSYPTFFTLSGGDPLANSPITLYIAQEFKKKFPTIKLWIWTGYIYENLQEDQLEVVRLCDVLIDGPFVLEQRDITLPFRGSINQRVIDVPQTLKTGTVVPYL